MYRPKRTARKVALVSAETTGGLTALLLILRRFIPELEAVPIPQFVAVVTLVVSTLHGIVDWIRHGR